VVNKIDITNPPDIFNFKISNPLPYIKYWWKKVMANEGIDVRVRVHPVTVFGIAVIAFSLAFGLGGVVLPFAFPWLNVNNGGVITTSTPAPSPSESDWRETALKGVLKKTQSVPVKFFLLTSSDEAVTLQAPDFIILNNLVGKRILASGNYNQKQKLLIITDVQDLEVLSSSPQAIPTVRPTPLASPQP
jgi:hypothetical protein